MGYPRGTSYNKIPILTKGQVLYNPVGTLARLKSAPFLRSEQLIDIGNMQVFAKQPTDLDFPSEGIVSDDEWRRL